MPRLCSERRSAWPAIVLMGLLLLPLLYVASVGPAWVWMDIKYEEEPVHWYETAYAPLIWLAQRSQTFDECMCAYAQLWVDAARDMPRF